MKSGAYRLAVLAFGLASCWIASGDTADAGTGCGNASRYMLSGQTVSRGDVGPATTTPGIGVPKEKSQDRGWLRQSRVMAWIRGAVENLRFIRPGGERVPAAVAADRSMDDRAPCGEAGPSNKNAVAGLVAPSPQAQITAAAVFPLPRMRPESSLAVRFGYAFLAGKQSAGAKSVAHELAARAYAVPSTLALTQ